MGKIVYPEIDLSNIKTIFIDIDDTLYQYEPCHKLALDYCADMAINYYSINLTKEDFKKIYKKYRKSVTERLHPQGICRSRLVTFMEFFTELGIDNSYNLALQFDKIYWDKLVSFIKLEDDATKLLKNAFANNITVATVTDMTTAEQIKKINKMGLEKYIKHVITSEMAGAEKPNKKIFQYALEISKADINTTIMIGDNMEKDGIGALNMGIKFYQVKTDV